jgi:hypothetical protein
MIYYEEETNAYVKDVGGGWFKYFKDVGPIGKDCQWRWNSKDLEFKNCTPTNLTEEEAKLIESL